jgi:AAA domain
MSAGRTEFCGRPLRKCKVLILTQEQDMLWNARREKLSLSDEVVFFQRGRDDWPRPFRGRPTEKNWEQFVGHLAGVVKDEGFELVVIDPLSDFWPAEDENNAMHVTDALAPLRQLTEAGASVLLLHHPRKNAEGDTAHRGSGQLAAYPDVLLELRRKGESKENQRRVLYANGRFDPPDDLEIELTEQGYVVVGSTEAEGQAAPPVNPAIAGVIELLPLEGRARPCRICWRPGPRRGPTRRWRRGRCGTASTAP